MTCAARITTYESRQIPLLLQQDGYAQIAADADRTLDPQSRAALPGMTGDLRDAVMTRGDAVTGFIVGEAAFRTLPDGDAGREQLAALTHASPPGLRVLPARTPAHPAPWAGSLTLLEFDGVPGCAGAVRLGGPGGGLFLTEEADVASCARVLSELRGLALADDAATGLITEAAARP